MDVESGSVESPQEPQVVADVAVDGAFGYGGRSTLSYRVPPELEARVGAGQLVWTPLRNQATLGLIMSIDRRIEARALKAIRAPVEPAFALDDDQIDTVHWLARESACSLFSAASPFLPPGVSHRAVEYLRLTRHGSAVDTATLTSAQAKLVSYLRLREESSLDAARAALKQKLTTVVPMLEAAGLIERVVRVVDAPPMPKRDRYVRLVRAGDVDLERAPKQRAVIDFLSQRARLAPAESEGLVPLSDVLARTGTDRATVIALARKGMIEEHAFSRLRTSREVEETPAPALTASQAAAWREIQTALERGDPTPILLHGVTGSGKTELYLRGVAWCLRHGRAVIVLVPEIPLATQVVRRFQARFPGEVAVLHSGLPDRERYATWQEIAAGEKRVVVGPRSALFAPVGRLGMIVLDEEHESAYKQESDPRYHARTLAEHIAAREGCPVILGSATPSIETFWRAEQGIVRRLSLPDRVGQRRDGESIAGALELPPVEIVDMRLELHRGQTSIISAPLQSLVARTLAAGEQAMLFLNRRGTSTVVLCRSCGETVACPNCDIPLVFHQDRGRMLCHRCNHRELPRSRCPVCNGALNYFGAGTQRVEEEVHVLFPRARVARWDQDSVRKQGGHERLLRAIEAREIDIVVGTQMIAKGLDLPMVTAIGVIHADTMLHFPDFRACERTFQLLTQVAGRAGRRAGGGRVIVQTYSPENYAVQAAARHDYEGFYREEIDFRRKNRYPPFARLARFLFRHQKEEVCAAEAEEQSRMLARHARATGVAADLIGPTPAFVGRLRGRYQWHVILRANVEEFDGLLDGLPVRPGWTVDVDPVSLL